MKVAVIGAGVCGLVAAHRLTQAGHAVDVYERWPGLGGQAATLALDDDGLRLERYYHHLFTSDAEIAALYEQLGLAIDWYPSSVAFYARGALHPFVGPLDLLRFSPLSPLARVRMGAAVLALQRFANDRAAFERVTARDWIRRWMGVQAWEEVWGPMLRGKFGERADEVAMVWLWSKLRLRRASDVRQERLGYPRGGWEPLLQTLARSIADGAGRVLIDRPVARIARAQDGSFVLAAGAPGSFRRGHDPAAFAPAGEARYDAVLATVACDIFKRLLAPEVAAAVGADYLGRCRAIEYCEALCLLLEIDRRFSPYYWTNVADRELPFVGVIEQTNLIAPAHYGGRRFLYVANYLPHGHELLGLDARALLARYEPGLRALVPSFSTAWVRAAWRFVEPDAQPIVTVGYGDRIPPLRTPVPGLVLANTAQVYPEDRGTNYAVRLGGEAAELMLSSPTPGTDR